MKNTYHISVALLLVAFLAGIQLVQAQVVPDTLSVGYSETVTLTSESDYFSMAVDAYNNQQYSDALIHIDMYAQSSEWHSSMGYWKVLIIDKNISYNNISDPLFIELTSNVNRLIKEASDKNPKERDLYLDHYKEIILIDEKINFTVLKLRWDNDATYQKALTEFKRNNLGVAKTHAEEAAKSNNGNALLLLGKIHETGYANNFKNYTTAMNFYQKAFLAGSYDAAYHIGYLYNHGYGVIKNINIAFKWCQIAATYRYIPAMKEISVMYKHGLGTIRNSELSKYWWDLSEIHN